MTKAESVGTKSNTRLEGFSTLEMLIAFVVVILSITAVIGVVFGSQSIGIDTLTNQEAQGLAQDVLEDARAKSKSDFGAIINATTTATIDGLTYDQETKVTDISPCAKQVDSLVTWQNEVRPQKVELVTALTSPREAAALGGDCASTPPSSNWENPQCLASDTFSPGKPTALDALRQKVYVGVDGIPFLAIADVESIPPDPCAGGSGNLFVEFTNGFDAGVKFNDIDVAKHNGSGKTYAYIAMDQNTEQFQVIDVTDITQPEIVAKLTLNNVNPGGSFPQGFRTYYYADRVYITVRETNGREFHVINVSNPELPSEIGPGFELNTSVYDLTVIDQNIGGTVYRFAYLATTRNSAELTVLDVTNPANITQINSASRDFPGDTDARALTISGNKLYIGQDRTSSGDELFVYDISNPISVSGLPLLGSVELNAGVGGLRASANFLFISTDLSNEEFQVRRSDPVDLSIISTHNFNNQAIIGLDYEPEFVYIGSLATPNFQIIHSP